MEFDFLTALEELGLTRKEAARFLGVDLRTVKRWTDDPNCMTGPAIQAIRAWLRLNHLGLAWRPGEVDLCEIDGLKDRITLYRNHTIQLKDVIDRVYQRGGPSIPWKVDLKKNVAILGPIRLWFVRLKDNYFSPTTYSRTAISIDMTRDKVLIEDAFACISAAILLEQKS